MILSIISVIGAALVTFGALLATREHAWLKKAQLGPGTVLALVKNGDSQKSVSTPRVRYTAQDGSIHDFIRNGGSTSTGFNVGEKVLVAYDPQTYESRLLTFSQRFGLAAAVSIAGLSLILMKVTFTYGERLLPRIYATQISNPSSVRVR